MPSLTTPQRRRLEKAVEEARKCAEAGAREVLQSLTVHEAKRGDHVSSPEQIQLRNRLRAHGRFLGDRRDATGAQSIDRLVEECAYQHWHRILFARFLAENDCLWHPQLRALVSLEEVEELAHEEGMHKWELAGRFAQAALPAIFPADNPVLAVRLPRETIGALIALVEEPSSEDDKSGLPRDIFLADDSLGWVYQFWQNDANEAANKSEEKINAATLPAVTQFFTEDYMVMFLLHNTLGAWHAGKVLAERPELAQTAKDENELRRAVALTEAGGYEFEYLRFVREPQTDDVDGVDGPWRPMGGTFDGWPRLAAELKVLDPCCGSGHFLVAVFELLVRLRMHEESLSVSEAIDAVLRDNLFGLELDKRCVQIAVFNVAMSAWKLDRYRELPSMTIAHVGQSIGATREQWMKLLKNEPGEDASTDGSDNVAMLPEKAQEGLGFFWGQLYDMFSQASTLGSLINPRRSLDSFLLSDEQTEYLYGLLERAVAADPNTEPESHELGLAAKGLATATHLLNQQYSLVITNVPYLGKSKQSPALVSHLDSHFRIGRSDLATAFVLRLKEFTVLGGTLASVCPQNWLFLTSYRKLRKRLLEHTEWNCIARLGAGAFDTISGEVVNVVLWIASNLCFEESNFLTGLDVSDIVGVPQKVMSILGENQRRCIIVSQSSILQNPDHVITLEDQRGSIRLRQFIESIQGIITGDYSRFGRYFWEIRECDGETWVLQQSTVQNTTHYGGRQSVVFWESGEGVLSKSENARIQGLNALGRNGVAVRQMGELACSLSTGELHDNNVAALIPRDEEDLAAIWCFASDPMFSKAARVIDQKLNITNATFGKIPIDIGYWRSIASERYPNGLPEPESDDPTQWLFHGWPSASTSPLQVAVARLIGYRWPAELDQEMRLSERARQLVARCSELEPLVDDDGIVCIPSVRGEEAAADRLTRLLPACDVTTNENLDDWLRNRFFKEHCETFDNRPFIWHIYDGRKEDGFHALVNYHKLAGPDGRKVLENLTYSYLGEWIDRQKDEVRRELPAAEARLLAAEDLFKRLEAILEGEPPYDIFVRWKPLYEQPIGWHPDINDGVRMNIRPFLASDLPGVPKGAGVLRIKPKSLKWTKDRGKEPERDKQDYPWFWNWDEKTTDFTGGDKFDGIRWNDCHYTRAAKQAAQKTHEENEQ